MERKTYLVEPLKEGSIDRDSVNASGRLVTLCAAFIPNLFTRE
jgi:hypothetical protein